MREGKQRHGCLTAWLVLMIVANLLTAVTNLAFGAALRQLHPDAPAWAMPVMGLACLANVAWAIALFRWKRWGFYAFVATAALATVINLMVGLNIVVAGGAAVVGVAILYGVLQIGGDWSGWSQLE
jgi:hypothetical protein